MVCVVLCGCSAAQGDAAGGDPEGQSISAPPDALKGCHGKASSSIPASGNYYLTTFGSGSSDDGIMSCGSYTKHGSWYYAASRQRYGCGSRIAIEANGKCVVAKTDDYGPDVCVENAAGRPIIDASPLVSKHLFGVSGCGYSDHLLVHVTEVAATTPLGPCQAPPACAPGSKRCNSSGTAVETCKSDGSGYTTTQSCSSGTCANGACQDCSADWACGAWSECACTGQQTRSCSDQAACGTSAGKPEETRACDPCAGGASSCAQCSGGCSYGTTGENHDSCAGVPAETWRCVYAESFGTSVSQVCRKSSSDGKLYWLNYHLDPANCQACCGAYVSGCS
jgi:hypothetical protein